MKNTRKNQDRRKYKRADIRKFFLLELIISAGLGYIFYLFTLSPLAGFIIAGILAINPFNRFRNKCIVSYLVTRNKRV